MPLCADPNKRNRIMRDVLFGVLLAALGLAFTFVYAGTITP
jgi:hypothetical protein